MLQCTEDLAVLLKSMFLSGVGTGVERRAAGASRHPAAARQSNKTGMIILERGDSL